MIFIFLYEFDKKEILSGILPWIIIHEMPEIHFGKKR